MPKPILKSGVRILRPSEYHQLHEGARTLENRTLCDALLLTRRRYVEAQRFQGNMDWLDGRVIHLPAFAQRKVKRQERERWIKLSSKRRSIIHYSLKTTTQPRP